MTIARTPWHVTGLQLRDADANIIAMFTDHRNAEHVIEMFAKIEELEKAESEKILDLEEQVDNLTASEKELEEEIDRLKNELSERDEA